MNGKITLGADAGIAAGPVGRNTALATDGNLKAEIWSWSRARGLFAGVALDGAVLSIDDDANQAVYGAGTTPRMIFEGRTAQPASDAIVDVRDQLEEATASARYARGTAGANAQVQAGGAVTAPVQVAPPVEAPVQAPPQPEPFETVENPATIEPLP